MLLSLIHFAAENAQAGESAIDIIAKVLVPIIVITIPLLWTTLTKTKKSAEQAAASVKPNGTGHSSIVHMVEDVLKDIGVILDHQDKFDEKLELVIQDFNAHINSTGHPETVRLAKEAADAAKQSAEVVKGIAATLGKPAEIPTVT